MGEDSNWGEGRGAGAEYDGVVPIRDRKLCCLTRPRTLEAPAALRHGRILGSRGPRDKSIDRLRLPTVTTDRLAAADPPAATRTITPQLTDASDRQCPALWPGSRPADSSQAATVTLSLRLQVRFAQASEGQPEPGLPLAAAAGTWPAGVDRDQVQVWDSEYDEPAAH